MSLLTDRYLPAVFSITEYGTDYLYRVYSVEKLRSKIGGDFICDLSVILYSRYKGIAEVA